MIEEIGSIYALNIADILTLMTDPNILRLITAKGGLVDDKMEFKINGKVYSCTIEEFCEQAESVANIERQT